MKKSNPFNKEQIFLIAFSISVAVIAIGVFVKVDFMSHQTDSIVYDEELLLYNTDWTVGLNGEIFEDTIVLPNYITATKKDEVVIQNELPVELTPGTFIAFRTEYSFVHVYVDDVLIYGNNDLVDTDKTDRVVSEWHFVPLGENCGGEKIEIVFISLYDYYSGIIPEIMIGTHAETLLYATSISSLDVKLSFSIVILGLLMVIFSLILFTNESYWRSYVYLGVDIAILGLFLISNISLPRTSAQLYYIDYLLMNFCLRMIPFVYSFYLFKRAKGRVKTFFWTLCCVSFANFIICTTLHFLFAVDFISTLHSSYAILFIVLGSSLYTDVLDGADKSLRYRILIAVGIGSFIFCASTDVYTHIAYKIHPTLDIFIFGALIFAILQTTAVLLSAYETALQQVEIEKQYNESKIKLMMSQIQPHFIYNSLTTIRVMIKCDPEKAYEMIYNFSNYLSYNFNALEDVSLVPFSEELKHISAYTDIEQERFFDRLTIAYDITDKSFVVPPLSIQPFVENAIKHGICKLPEGGQVLIKSYSENDYNIIEIHDDGIGFVYDPTKGHRGVGIKNASYRLRSLASALIEIDSQLGKGTIIKIKLPKIRRGKDNENDIGR